MSLILFFDGRILRFMPPTNKLNILIGQTARNLVISLILKATELLQVTNTKPNIYWGSRRANPKCRQLYSLITCFQNLLDIASPRPNDEMPE